MKVGIVDTGITQTHEDLTGKTADCAQSVAARVVIQAGACVDDNGHGTHVAGTITANANNGKGVAGVAFNSPLAICKALSGPLGQGTTADVANCITWADRPGRQGHLDEPRRRRRRRRCRTRSATPAAATTS